jgi:hypothetical protein
MKRQADCMVIRARNYRMMARQIGPLKYQGTLGDIRHFKIEGLSGTLAGLIGGPSGEQVKPASEFERTRENMNEFSGCASAGKSIRVGVSQLMKQMSDPELTGRLTPIMKKINLEDQTEARGYRAREKLKFQTPSQIFFAALN